MRLVRFPRESYFWCSAGGRRVRKIGVNHVALRLDITEYAKLEVQAGLASK